MKYSQVLASVLFGSMAAAFPFKRDLVTQTNVVMETVVVFTTVYEDDLPVPEATVADATPTAGGYFYEQPSAAVTTPAVISTPAAAPSPVQEPSSVYTPPVETPAAPSSKAAVSSAAPAPVVEPSSAPAPAAPTTTEAAYTPAPAPSTSAAPAPATSAAPAPASSAAAQQQSTESYSSGSSSTGESFSGVDLTINPVTGALGACGEPMYPTDLTVALAQPAWGASTYDTMTGKATNKWCGQKIRIEYNGKSVDATVMDMCPGCSGHDIDLSDATWAAIGMTEWTRVQGSWSVIN
ncbi:hypothetical protein OPT61_g7178 [Boeremia exigua]|uniref:Uncharacterized protein n=1 Tax=Boeremia exigua TaxID=749465 RepID=A0ACC2I3U7_9PLEO|nr:hypothetical protein OPT61_g7178 [Boeremia exigua]